MNRNVFKAKNVSHGTIVYFLNKRGKLIKAIKGNAQIIYIEFKKKGSFDSLRTRLNPDTYVEKEVQS